MVRVTGGGGKAVNVQILGVGEVMRMLRAKGKKIERGADFGVVRAGTFIQEEVKESIIGNRAEPKSVDSGRLANSIEFEKTGKAQGVVKPKKEGYPNSKATTEDVATFMEYGTSRNPHPRSHFRNTKTRNINKVEDIIKSEIKRAV